MSQSLDEINEELHISRKNIVLACHVSDQQMHHLLNVLQNAEWSWRHCHWEKGETDAVQGARMRYASESWFV